MTARAQKYGDLGLSKLPWFFNGLGSANSRHLMAKFVASQQISHLVTFLRLGFYVKLCPSKARSVEELGGFAVFTAIVGCHRKLIGYLAKITTPGNW